MNQGEKEGECVLEREGRAVCHSLEDDSRYFSDGAPDTIIHLTDKFGYKTWSLIVLLPLDPRGNCGRAG